MKIGIYADPHFACSSSIILGKQGEFTGRLDNLIRSFKWMNETFKENNVKAIYCLGDFTDKTTLTSEELTAISKCDLTGHTCLVGNHCRSTKSGEINSISAFIPKVVSEPTVELLAGLRILLLPYNSDIADLSQYEDIDVILSHNDLKGYDFGGGHMSTSGYEASNILKSCRLFINGHLHNGGWVVKDRIVNLGQLSGMNFSSCGGEWEPSVGILDTTTLKLDIIPNPVAYRFKKLEFNSMSTLKSYLDNLPNDGEYILQIKIPEDSALTARKLLDQCNRITASRVVTYRSKSEVVNTYKETPTLERVPMYKKLQDFISTQTPKCNQKLLQEIIQSLSEERSI